MFRAAVLLDRGNSVRIEMVRSLFMTSKPLVVLIRSGGGVQDMVREMMGRIVKVARRGDKEHTVRVMRMTR